MNKIFILILLQVFFLASYAAEYTGHTGNSMPTSHTGNSLNAVTKDTALRKIQKSNSILNVDSAIQADQKTTSSQFYAADKNDVPKPAANPNTYVPRVYRFGTYGASQTVNNNNTYIYQQSAEPAASSSTAQKEEIKTQEEKDEIERQALRKKYSSILSNKTTSNEKMCTQMCSYYKNVSDEELDRVLNKILRLNCDISKLRPGYLN